MSWPTSTRTGGLSDVFAYSDGPWTLGTDSAADYLGYIEQSRLFTVSDGATFRSGELASYNPFLVRALEDDDRLTSNATTLSLTASITGALSGALGPLYINLSATGSLCGGVGLRHTLRDAVIAEGGAPPGALFIPAQPVQVVTVSPSAFAAATVSFDVHLLIQLTNIPFVGTINIVNTDLFNAGPLTLAAYDTLANPATDPWKEENKLRLATGSSLLLPLDEPLALSHLPNGGQFLSFPPSVTSCLASAAPNEPPPPPCQSTPPAQPTPPQTDICILNGLFQPRAVGGGGSGAAPLPSDACQNVATYVAEVGGDAAQLQCTKDYLSFLCSPVSKEQTYSSQEVVARLVLTQNQSADATTATELKQIINECIDANIPPGPQAQALAQAYVQNQFSFAFCDSQANLLGPAQVLSGAADPTQPPAVSPGTCH